jgi:hypothetical protein
MSRRTGWGSVRTVVVAHPDVHGVASGVLAAKAFGAEEVYCEWPDTTPKRLVVTLRDLYAAAPQRLRLVLVDIPVDSKNPAAFVRGLEDLADRHEVVYIDHHEQSRRYVARFKRVKGFYVGPSALEMSLALVEKLREPSVVDYGLAMIGAVGDRDPEFWRRQDVLLWGLKFDDMLEERGLKTDLLDVAEGLDFLVRERGGARKVAEMLLDDPMVAFKLAVEKLGQVPVPPLKKRVGVVAVAGGELPSRWAAKSLSLLAARSGCWYAIGYYRERGGGRPVVRAVQYWLYAGVFPTLPAPENYLPARYKSRSRIGHKTAPAVVVASVEEAEKLVEEWAEILDEMARLWASLTFILMFHMMTVNPDAAAELLQTLDVITGKAEERIKKLVEELRRSSESGGEGGGAKR